MKKFYCLLICLFFCLSINAQIITGEVEYNSEYSESGITKSQNTNRNDIYRFLIDRNNQENLNSLSGGVTELKDRKLMQFSDGSYGVQYYDDPMFSWYYSQNGRLINFTEKDSLTYPCKTVKYKPDGSIANTGYRVSEKESFIYNTQGKLIAHWLNGNCYDEYNNIIMTRKELK